MRPRGHPTGVVAPALAQRHLRSTRSRAHLAMESYIFSVLDILKGVVGQDEIATVRDVSFSLPLPHNRHGAEALNVTFHQNDNTEPLGYKMSGSWTLRFGLCNKENVIEPFPKLGYYLKYRCVFCYGDNEFKRCMRAQQGIRNEYTRLCASMSGPAQFCELVELEDLLELNK